LPRSGATSSELHPAHGIKFYTAEISPRAALDEHSVQDQRSYHAALAGHHPNAVKMKIVKGSYAIDKIDARKVECCEDGKEKEPKYCSTVKVWKLEEKQSDVNVAIDAVFDAFTDHSIEQVVFATNDTDIFPALKKLQELNALGIRSPIEDPPTMLYTREGVEAVLAHAKCFAEHMRNNA